MFKPNTATLGNLLLHIILGAIVVALVMYVLASIPADMWDRYYMIKDAIINLFA